MEALWIAVAFGFGLAVHWLWTSEGRNRPSMKHITKTTWQLWRLRRRCRPMPTSAPRSAVQASPAPMPRSSAVRPLAPRSVPGGRRGWGDTVAEAVAEAERFRHAGPEGDDAA